MMRFDTKRHGPLDRTILIQYNDIKAHRVLSGQTWERCDQITKSIRDHCHCRCLPASRPINSNIAANVERPSEVSVCLSGHRLLCSRADQADDVLTSVEHTLVETKSALANVELSDVREPLFCDVDRRIQEAWSCAEQRSARDYEWSDPGKRIPRRRSVARERDVFNPARFDLLDRCEFPLGQVEITPIRTCNSLPRARSHREGGSS